MKKSLLWTFLLSQSIFFLSLPWLTSLTTYLQTGAALIVINLILVCMIGIGVSIIRKTTYFFKPVWIHLFFIIYGGGIGVLLFKRPSHNINRTVNLTPFDTMEMYMSGDVNRLISFYNLFANIGLFLPFGLYAACFWKRWSTKVFIPIMVIFMIEVIQLVTGRGSLDIDDVILNVTGVFLGYGLTPFFNKIVVLRKT